MRGWVSHLQLLLALASAVILVSESCRTHDHILLSQIRDSPNLEGHVPYLYPPGTGWPSYIPRHWVPFSLSLMIHRATVEVFRPTFTRCWVTGQLASIYTRFDTGAIENAVSVVLFCYVSILQQFLHCHTCICCHGNMFTEPLLSNGPVWFCHFQLSDIMSQYHNKYSWEFAFLHDKYIITEQAHSSDMSVHDIRSILISVQRLTLHTRNPVMYMLHPNHGRSNLLIY
jgi:hypothetical protein